MSRPRVVAVVAVALSAVAPAALAHEGNPNFKSEVHAVVPAVEGLTAEVVDHDDRIELRNDSGRPIVVEGYEDEPYLRIAADGTVAVNRRAPTYYLNQDRFAAGVEVPRSADAKAPPDWHVEDRSGQYAWHDHRIHWMSRTVPPQVKDEGKRTKVFDWKVPLEVGGRPATVDGSLVWVGKPGGGFPLGAGLALAGVVLAGATFTLIVRRGRRGKASDRREAW